jgi:hypothetical protein
VTGERDEDGAGEAADDGDAEDGFGPRGWIGDRDDDRERRRVEHHRGRDADRDENAVQLKGVLDLRPPQYGEGREQRARCHQPTSAAGIEPAADGDGHQTAD